MTIKKELTTPLQKKMIMTMRPDLASRYARSNRAERQHLVEEVQAELVETAPSVKVVGTINFSTRVMIDENEVDSLQSGLADRFLVESDYTMVTLSNRSG